MDCILISQKKHNGSVTRRRDPGTEIKQVADLVQGSQFFFCPQMQASQAHHLSHLLGMGVARTFSHLALVQSVVLPLIGSDPRPHSIGEILFPNNPCWGFEVM